jgi:hypothetical protein
MVAIEIGAAAFGRMRSDLRSEVEQAGFFLADYESPRHTFVLGEWLPVPTEGFEIQTGYHISLTDETQTAIFRRAAAADQTLVEVHSHLGAGRAEFSPSDIFGFSEWVPQVRWRVGRRPYAAMVWDESSFDALAWIELGGEADQVTELIVTGPESLTPTALTLPGLHAEGSDVAL